MRGVRFGMGRWRWRWRQAQWPFPHATQGSCKRPCRPPLLLSNASAMKVMPQKGRKCHVRQLRACHTLARSLYATKLLQSSCQHRSRTRSLTRLWKASLPAAYYECVNGSSSHALGLPAFRDHHPETTTIANRRGSRNCAASNESTSLPANKRRRSSKYRRGKTLALHSQTDPKALQQGDSRAERRSLARAENGTPSQGAKAREVCSVALQDHRMARLRAHPTTCRLAPVATRSADSAACVAKAYHGEKWPKRPRAAHVAWRRLRRLGVKTQAARARGHHLRDHFRYVVHSHSQPAQQRGDL